MCIFSGACLVLITTMHNLLNSHGSDFLSCEVGEPSH